MLLNTVWVDSGRCGTLKNFVVCVLSTYIYFCVTLTRVHLTILHFILAYMVLNTSYVKLFIGIFCRIWKETYWIHGKESE